MVKGVIFYYTPEVLYETANGRLVVKLKCLNYKFTNIDTLR